MTTWHDDDTFWHDLGGVFFTDESWEQAGIDVDGVCGLAGFSPGMRVLDLGCGPGRHSIALAQRGYHVTGVDRTLAYLEQARARAAREGVKIDLVDADMRAFRCADAFDAVINLFSSFAYFDDPEDDRRVLENVRDALRPGGRFIIDLMSKEVLARVFTPTGWRRGRGDAIVFEERAVLDGWQQVETRWTLIHGGERREHVSRMRLYSAVELGALLTEVGFSEWQAYGNLQGKPYDTNAERLVIVATRSA